MTVSLARSLGGETGVDLVDAAVVDVGPPLLDRRRASPLLLASPASTRASTIGQPLAVEPRATELTCSARRRRSRLSWLSLEVADLGTEEDLGRLLRGGQAASPWTSRVSSSAKRRWLSRSPGSFARATSSEFDLLVREFGEQSQALAGIGVVEVDPVLVELVGARALGDEPDGPGLGLAHLGAVGSWSAAGRSCRRVARPAAAGPGRCRR